MSISIQTNVNSLNAQQNLSVNSAFQSQTIQRLTSGFRINSSSDDAAGLAIANKFRSDTAELTQGVRNANDGISQLQIIDGGLNNISKMLDRLKTLATQSASTTFTGSRATLNNEFQSLLSEVDRQAKNIKLDSNGIYASKMSVYIGGGNSSNATNSNAMVSVDLTNSGVDSAGLKLNNSSVLGGGVDFSGVTLTNAKLSDPNSRFTASQSFTVSWIDSNGVAQTDNSGNVSYTGSTSLTGDQAVAAINASLASQKVPGITAQIGTNGQLQFVGNGAFTVTTTSTANGVVTSGSALQVVNTGMYHEEGGSTFTGYANGTGASSIDQLTFTDASTNKTATITLNAANADTLDHAVAALNAKFQQSGLKISALNENGTLSYQSAGDFSVNLDAHTAATGTGAGATGFGTTLGKQGSTSINTQASATGAALTAIDSITSALATLGTIQGKIGAGQNQLGYAISLAQSQITNFSAAQAQIRDTDVAAEAANLTKASVLQQASMAAMAQANSAPQAVLSLLRG
jgi:flagellin